MVPTKPLRAISANTLCFEIMPLCGIGPDLRRPLELLCRYGNPAEVLEVDIGNPVQSISREHLRGHRSALVPRPHKVDDGRVGVSSPRRSVDVVPDVRSGPEVSCVTVQECVVTVSKNE